MAESTSERTRSNEPEHHHCAQRPPDAPRRSRPCGERAAQSPKPCEDCVVPKPRKLDMKVLSLEQMGAYLEAAQRRDLLPMCYLELLKRPAEGRTGGPAVGRSGYPQQNHLGEQAVCTQPGWLTGTDPPQDREFRAAGVHSADGGGPADPGTRKAPGQPISVPLAPDGEMYHPDSVVNLHKKILKDAGLEHLSFHDLRHTFATTALQNGVDVKTVSSMPGHFDAGFHPAHLHPRHAAEAGRGPPRPWAAVLGAGHVTVMTQQHEKAHWSGRQIFPSGALLSFPAVSACGSRCGSAIFLTRIP